MNRRTFLQKGSLAGIAGMMVAHSNALWAGPEQSEFIVYEAEAPAYALDALEPYIDQKTMEVHYTFHHKGYSKNLNAALEKAADQYRKMPLTQLFAQLDSLPETLQPAIRNHGGGHWNHNLFWKCMAPASAATTPSEKTEQLIGRDYGSLENLKKEFTAAAMSVFGSGWAWLVWNGAKIEIQKTANQVNPLMNQAEGARVPLLGVDVWEHAYYLKCQNRRAEYLENFWKIVDWRFVSSQLPG